MAELEAKRYLSRLDRKRVQILTLEQQIRQLEDHLYNPLKAVTYDRDVVQTSHAGSGGMEKIEELADMQVRLKGMREKLIRDIDKAREEIWQIESTTYMQFLSIVYLEGGTIMNAADRMGMSYERARHVHGEALKEFQRTVLDQRRIVITDL